jgi:signal transduction histidine kinase
MSALEPARRSLATAARALDAFKNISGAEGSGEAPPSGWRVPAETGARAALDEARARVAELSAELDKARLAAAGAANASEGDRRDAALALEEAAAMRARAAALDAELAAAGEALAAAGARERRAEEGARESEAAWTARLELLEREVLSAARAGAQRELAAKSARVAALEADLETALTTAASLEAEASALREAAESRAASRADTRSNADFAQRRASEAASRVSLLEAECVRLERLRHAADQATADAEAQGRAVAEALRREMRVIHASLDQAAVEAGAAEAKARGEADALRGRLESAIARLQALEREKRLDQARGTGESAAVQTELLRAQAVAAAQRQELSNVRAEEGLLRRRAAEAQAALERIVAERPAELERALASSQAAEAQIASLQMELVDARARAAAKEAVDDAPYVSPALEPTLDPGWARLLRLVRPSVDAAYAHLRRLSGTALTAGQKTLLRMGAASIAQASDSLSSIELALEEGPAPGAPSSVLPALEESLGAWEAAFRSRGVALAREVPATLPEAAHDPKELRVALHHVLRNALEAVPRGGRLAVRAWRGPDGALRVEFADDGPGFPAEWLARRFEPFAAPRRGRAGLGLSLVRRTLRRWGGDAEAANGASRKGARLTLIFAAPPPPAPAPQ